MQNSKKFGSFLKRLPRPMRWMILATLYVVAIVPLLIFMGVLEILPGNMGRGQFHLLLARDARRFKRRNLARRLLNRALIRADVIEDDVFSGSICHKAHTLLGIMALEDGDEDAARAHLIASTQWGPIHEMDLSLARKLRKRGHLSEVLDYYERLIERSPHEEWNAKTQIWIEEMRNSPEMYDQDYRNE